MVSIYALHVASDILGHLNWIPGAQSIYPRPLLTWELVSGESHYTDEMRKWNAQHGHWEDMLMPNSP
jgi:hypothetical protein